MSTDEMKGKAGSMAGDFLGRVGQVLAIMLGVGDAGLTSNQWPVRVALVAFRLLVLALLFGMVG